MGLFKGLWSIQIEKFPLAPDSRFGCGPAPISLAAAPRSPAADASLHVMGKCIAQTSIFGKSLSTRSSVPLPSRRTPAGFSRGGLGAIPALSAPKSHLEHDKRVERFPRAHAVPDGGRDPVLRRRLLQSCLNRVGRQRRPSLAARNICNTNCGFRKDFAESFVFRNPG